jgi:hypothetical protein
MAMRRVRKLGRTALAVMACQQLIPAIDVPARALAYCRAAERDEENGYRLTAAMQWRKAALLLAPVPAAAVECWRQWERIMHLPRRLARPIPSSPASVPGDTTLPASSQGVAPSGAVMASMSGINRLTLPDS